MTRPSSYRIRRGEELRRTQEDACNATIFILKEFGPTSFLLQDDSHRKFKVHIGQEHSCTCNEFKKKRELCVHICWVLLKRFKVDKNNSVGWQLGLVEREIQDLLEGKHSRIVQPTSNTSEDKSDEEPANSGEIRQRSIGPEDICAICQDELLGEQRYPVTFCRKGCGNSVHIRCMRVWTDHQRKQKSINLSESVPCPICREEFGQLGMLLREITENIHPRERTSAKRKSTVVAPTVQSIQPILKTKHPQTVCMSCGAAPICGNIYRCQSCEEQLDLKESPFMCAACFRQGKHPEHDRFMYREGPNGKWVTVDANRCIPTNLGRVLQAKFSVSVQPKDIMADPRWIHSVDEVETLRLCDLARLPHWTIRQPRNRQPHPDRSISRQATETKTQKPMGDFLSQLLETAERGRVDGSHARLANWGSIMTTGLLAPGRQCRICLMAFRMGDAVRRLVPGCEHIFHAACIDPWLLHQAAICPLDGSPIIPMSTGSHSPATRPSCTREAESELHRFADLQVHANALCSRPIKQMVRSPGRVQVPATRAETLHSACTSGFTVVGQSAMPTTSTRTTKSSRWPRNVV